MDDGKVYSDGERDRESKLFVATVAELYLIDGAEVAFMRKGGFRLFLAQHSFSPLAAVEAMVGDLQWPVGKDSLVSRTGAGRFLFTLPGITYCLVFVDDDNVQQSAASRDGRGRTEFDKLATILQRYAPFTDRSGTAHSSSQACEEIRAATFWTKAAHEVEHKSSSMAKEISSSMSNASGVLQMAKKQANMAPESEPMAALSLHVEAAGRKSLAGGGNAPGLSPRMMKRMQQARRISAVAKLFSKALVKGLITQEMVVATAEAGVGHVDGGDGRCKDDVAMATVEGVARVVQAVETLGGSVYDEAGSLLTWMEGTDGTRLGAVGGPIAATWTLNKLGLRALLGAIAGFPVAAGSKSGSAACRPRPSSSSSGTCSSSTSSSTSSCSSHNIGRRCQGTDIASAPGERQPGLIILPPPPPSPLLLPPPPPPRHRPRHLPYHYPPHR